MKTISLNEFYSDIKKYVHIVIKGGDIIISDKNKPIFYIEPIKKNNKRPYGLCKDEFKVPDDFDAELPDDIIANFEGK